MSNLVLIILILILIRLSYVLYLRNQTRDLLKKVIRILTENSVSYWLDFNSLLFVMRTGDVETGFSSINLCVLYDEENQEFLEKSLLKLAENSSISRTDTKIQIKNNNGLVSINLVLASLLENNVITGESSSINKDIIFPIVPNSFVMNNEIINAMFPVNPFTLLEQRYGIDFLQSNRKEWYYLYFS